MTFYQKHKTPIIIIVAIILLAVILGGGRNAYKFHKSELERLESLHEGELQALELELIEIVNSKEQRQKKIRTYEKEYYRERAKNKRLRDQINAIPNRIYNIPYLDSLSSTVTYPR